MGLKQSLKSLGSRSLNDVGHLVDVFSVLRDVRLQKAGRPCPVTSLKGLHDFGVVCSD